MYVGSVGYSRMRQDVGIDMKLYHVTTEKKAKRYRESGGILSPVRGFDTLMAAMAWAIKTGRTVIYEFDAIDPHMLPDHHNEYGKAWWNDGNIHNYKCIFSANNKPFKEEGLI